MSKINELKLAKELIRFPSITPIDAGVMEGNLISSFANCNSLILDIFNLLKDHLN